MKDNNYEVDKELKKQKLARNEFLYHGNSVGKLDIPIIKKQDLDILATNC